MTCQISVILESRGVGRGKGGAAKVAFKGGCVPHVNWVERMPPTESSYRSSYYPMLVVLGRGQVRETGRTVALVVM